MESKSKDNIMEALKTVGAGLIAVVFMIGWFILSLAIPVLIIALGIRLYNSWQEPEIKPVETVQTIQPQKNWADKYYADYMQSCAGEGFDQTCKCVFNYLTQNMSEQEFVQLSLLANTDENKAMRNTTFQNSLKYCTSQQEL